jgi:hypothetical protein
VRSPSSPVRWPERALEPDATLETLLIRAFGAAAFVLLHVILAIGPLCRLDARFLPAALQPPSHGREMFLLALCTERSRWSSTTPWASLSAARESVRRRRRRTGFAGIPFQPLGALALAILFAMAATSHDFWLANLTAHGLEALHMLVYVAYALLVLHVSLGVLQSDRSPWLVALVGVGLVTILAFALARGSQGGARRCRTFRCAQRRLRRRLRARRDPREARQDRLRRRRSLVAIFRYDGKISAVSNACQHPERAARRRPHPRRLHHLSVARLQYDPQTGASPPPSREGPDLPREGREGGACSSTRGRCRRGTRVEPALASR